MITLATAQRACCLLIGLAVVQQSAELLALRRAYADDGVWGRSLLAGDLRAFARPVAALLRTSYAPGAFSALLVTRLLAGGLLVACGSETLPAQLAVGWALLSTLVVCIRFRGSFNGGSDAMTVAVLCGLACASFGGRAAQIGLLYVAVQALASYAIAGFAKLKEPRWRSGEALRDLLALRSYGVPSWLAMSRAQALLAAWGVIGFEVAAPWSLVSPDVCAGYLALALLFHLGTVLAFGLNRFVWAWAASYPALLWLAGALDSTRR